LYLNSPPPPLFFTTTPPIPGMFSTGIVFTLIYTVFVHSICTISAPYKCPTPFLHYLPLPLLPSTFLFSDFVEEKYEKKTFLLV
jgi:hypothetical protein